jgi:hypothetical protein
MDLTPAAPWPHRLPPRRPGTPGDQAWTQSFSGHLKDENPHPDKIRDGCEFEAELGARP